MTVMRTNHRLQSRVERLAAAHAIFLIGFGAWPNVHMRSFEAVTGKKREPWLVRAVGLLLVTSGSALALAASRRTTAASTRLLATGVSTSLGRHFAHLRERAPHLARVLRGRRAPRRLRRGVALDAGPLSTSGAARAHGWASDSRAWPPSRRGTLADRRRARGDLASALLRQQAPEVLLELLAKNRQGVVGEIVVRKVFVHVSAPGQMSHGYILRRETTFARSWHPCAATPLL